MNLKKEWLILGAGLHGVHLACRLLDSGVPLSQLALLDRHPTPLHLWTSLTQRLDMGYLRSTAVHHIGLSPWSLLEYATEHYGNPDNWSAPPYQRPSYEVFQEHCREILEEYALAQAFHRFEAKKIVIKADGTFLVESEDEILESRNLTLAVGQPPPRYPSWASRTDPRIHHLLSPRPLPTVERANITVVGAGMTGAQFALAQASKNKVTLVTPKPLEEQNFDADPCWIGPKCVNRKYTESSALEKRATIRAARQPGTINHQVHAELVAALDSGKVRLIVDRAARYENRCLTLESGTQFPCDHLYLATGFEKTRPGGALVDNLIQSAGLPVAPCGFPITTPNLQWAPGLYVTGGLAELTLGPVARNITGARSAAKLIVDGLELGTNKTKVKEPHEPELSNETTPGHSALRLLGSRQNNPVELHTEQPARA